MTQFSKFKVLQKVYKEFSMMMKYIYTGIDTGIPQYLDDNIVSLNGRQHHHWVIQTTMLQHTHNSFTCRILVGTQ